MRVVIHSSVLSLSKVSPLRFSPLTVRRAGFKPFWPPALFHKALEAIIIEAFRRFHAPALLVMVLNPVLPAWRLPAALAGGVSCSLAGLNRALLPHRNQPENTAMLPVCAAATAHAWAGRTRNAA